MSVLCSERQYFRVLRSFFFVETRLLSVRERLLSVGLFTRCLQTNCYFLTRALPSHALILNKAWKKKKERPLGLWKEILATWRYHELAKTMRTDEDKHEKRSFWKTWMNYTSSIWTSVSLWRMIQESIHVRGLEKLASGNQRSDQIFGGSHNRLRCRVVH